MEDRLKELLMTNLGCDEYDARDILIAVNRVVKDEIVSFDVSKSDDGSSVLINEKYDASLDKKHHLYAIKDRIENRYIYTDYE